MERASLPPGLERASIPQPVLAVVRRLGEAGHPTFLVGGCVRDMVRGVTPSDFDVATGAPPRTVQGLFRRVIPTGIDHGTVTVIEGGEPIEVTTFRTEGGYVDGRRPSEIRFHDDVLEDLSRRDFTINAMAYDPVGRRLIDPHAGRDDLEAGLIRCVGDAHERFSEDGLRPMRAVRFQGVLGFSIEPATEAAIPSTLEVFAKVARERVCVELTKLLLGRYAPSAVETSGRTGLLGAIFPELEPTLASAPAFAAVVAALGTLVPAPKEEPDRSAALVERLALLLAAVPSREAAAAARRLTLPRRVVEDLELLVAHQAPPDACGWSPGRLRRLAASVGRQRVPSLLRVAGARAVAVAGPGEVDPGGPPLEARMAEALDGDPPLTTRELALDGKGIMEALGSGPGPQVGRTARELLERVLEEPELNTAERLRALIGASPQKPPSA